MGIRARVDWTARKEEMSWRNVKERFLTGREERIVRKRKGEE